MANLSKLMAKNTLDWTLGVGGAIGQPAGNFMGIASIAVSSDATTGEWVEVGYTRQSCNMATASTPAGSAISSNSSQIIFGPVTLVPPAVVVASGVFLTDNAGAGLGTQVYWGSFAQARTLQNGDQLIVNVAGLSITLS